MKRRTEDESERTEDEEVDDDLVEDDGEKIDYSDEEEGKLRKVS